MKLKNIASVLGGLLLMAGCASVSQQRAVVIDGTIQNTSLGFFGFTFQIPSGFEVYSPAAKNPAEYNELQRMAIRIYDINKAYHPRGNEQFYESFLLMSDKSCFLLITLKSAAAEQLYNSPFDDSPVSQWELMPLYNVTMKRSFGLGDTRQPAVHSRGSAYEQKGWYYADSKRNSILFNYEACKVTGSKRDSYILMGFALPENAKALTVPTQQMIEGLKF
jgi:hypothetical protein